MFRQIVVLLLLLSCSHLPAQVSYTAHDQINAYNQSFRYGSNLSNYPPWTNAEVANIAAGNEDLNIQGIGVQSFRNALPEHFLETWGYDIRQADFQHWESLGMSDHLTILGYPSEDHRDPTQYCNGVDSELFANMYEPIWDGGANGTPVNEDNYYANYIYQLATEYQGQIKFYEVWNEPDFALNNNAWLPPGNPNSWWDSNPSPCEYNLAAPIFHYIRLLRISYEVIKTVDPNAYICTGGLGNPAFLDAILRNTDNPTNGGVNTDFPLKGGAYFDVLSYHSYPHIDGSMWEFPAGGGLFYYRHSDRGVEGMLGRQASFRTVLEDRGYDGTTYPEKLWFLSETMVPRKQFNNYIGSDEAQVNYLMKALTEAQRNDFVQVDVYTISETLPFDDAWNEYATMGLFEHLSNALPYEFTLTEAGKAYHTMTALMPSLTYDAAKTNAMNLPAGVKGAAFQKGNQHVFILWAVTTEDMSEAASATYSFPASFDLDDLEIFEYDYSVTGTASMTAPDNISLTGTPIIFSEELPMGVAPTASFTANTPSGCVPFTVQFADNSAGEPTAWSWSFEGANIASSTVQNPTVTYLNAGEYGVTLTASNDFGMNTTSQNNLIVAADLPTASFNLVVDEMFVQLTNTSQNGDTFVWTFSDGQMIDDILNPTVIFTENGTYTATLSVTNSCGTTTTTETFVIDVVATNEITGISKWSIFPNPNQGQFYLMLEGTESKELTVAVRDVFGKELLKDTFVKKVGQYSKTFDLNDFPTGLYLLTMQAGEEVVVEKVIVE